MKDQVTPLLLNPQRALKLNEAQWDDVLRQARRANLLARLADDLQANGLLQQIPTYVQPHFEAIQHLSARQKIAMLREIKEVARALAEANIPLILMKGAAYLARDLPCAQGRLFGDIDLLVPQEAIPEVESTLLLHGWITTHHNPYDQAYYRRWMHEIPPLKHVIRHSVLDVHHNILPATAKHPPDANLLRASAQPVDGLENVYTLTPVDMVLHSACHLFHEGELHNGLRDLADLDRLLRHFAGQAGFWQELLPRAQQLHLERPLYYALQFTQVLQTLIPPDIAQAVKRFAPAAPQAMLMRALYSRALRPAHPMVDDVITPLARWLLYVRGHWLRMPPYLLAYHLSRKALMRYLGLEEKEDADVQQGQNKNALKQNT